MITIHKVQKDEIREVKKLLSHTWKETYGTHYPQAVIEKVTSVWHAPEALAAQATDPNGFFAVAKEENGEIVGLISMRKLDEETLFMNRLYVHPNHQRKGIGSMLLNAAYKQFPGIKKMRLECDKNNKNACSFYEKKSFKKIGEKDEHIEGATMRTVIWEKDLHQTA